MTEFNIWMIVSAVLSLAGLVFALLTLWKIYRIPLKHKELIELQSFIKEGAMAFMIREYKSMAIFVVILFPLLGFFGSWAVAIAFLVGSLFSAGAGFIGMLAATSANAKTTAAAEHKGMTGALAVAFSGGSVMGTIVVGLGLGGILILLAIYIPLFGIDHATTLVTGFSLGASSIALFSRVGGGIFTKAADVGADLVGKVEQGIPEDDPRNPAVIADNVGDNVGDVAGMGADLFESYVGAIISSLALGVFRASTLGMGAYLFPITLSGIGIIASILGGLFVRTKKDPQRALTFGTYMASLIVLVGALGLSLYFFNDFKAFLTIVVGLVVGLAIGMITEIYTSADYHSVKHIADQSQVGAATTVISGLSVGMYSVVFPLLFLVAGILVSYYLMGVYGISLAAVGMLSTTGITVAVDAYGPIADNAGGLAEMAHLDHHVREITDKLDSVGNTTAAIGKGFAIGSAALTSMSLFVTFIVTFNQATGSMIDITTLMNLSNPIVISGIFIGGLLPFLFSAMTMESVGRAAQQMIEEVRRQFRADPGILLGTSKPDYSKCVDISTQSALKEMLPPGILAIIAPIAVGLLLGYNGLGGMLAGSLVTGVLLSIFMANAGGAWDNAKKSIEADGGKGSNAHKAAVVGDTIGDPFKDTSGPSLNILIKLMSIVSLIFIPLFILINNGAGLLG